MAGALCAIPTMHESSNYAVSHQTSVLAKFLCVFVCWFSPSQWFMHPICICLLANDVEHLFTSPFAIDIFSLVKHLFKPFAHFLIQLLVLLLSFESFLYIFTQLLFSYVICRYFLPACSLSFKFFFLHSYLKTLFLT